ncbi:MAG: cupin domain-containing protein, partial [Woeseiaceae bacterium]|nr:cupin domain-containing protein [Woeseiaceae bacterium]
MPKAIEFSHPELDADELAWLATQHDVESRIVFTHVDGTSTSYEVEDGPFDEHFLGQLPATNWTLIVQDVEKHLPDFRALFAAVDFIPDWRIDDLMISYAAPGGGVGPHLDTYDVFLYQCAGQREWRLGSAGECEPDPSNNQLSLLLPFADEHPYLAHPGDVLYLPPAVPHWGLARDFCMTWSIGMRAPNLAELKAGAERLLEQENVDIGSLSPGDADVFYADPDLAVDEAEPGMIAHAAVQRAGRLLGNA